MNRARAVAIGIGVALLAGIGAASCGDSQEPAGPTVAWPDVSAKQVAEAETLGVPVRFENDLGMRFVLVPAGSYRRTMPHDPTDPAASETWEEVEIPAAFYLQVTEVTNAQYQRLRPDHDSGSYESISLKGDRQPAVKLSWHAAVAFANWLSKQDPSHTYRLPSDVEWECACRAGTTTPYPWGESEADVFRYANVLDATTREEMGLTEEPIAGDDGHRVTAPVGSFLPNDWGFYDLIGNAWEWCSDTPPSPFPGPGGERPPSNRRVARGGSWITKGEEIKSSARLEVPSRITTATVLGFRLAVPVTSGHGPK